jgi:ribonuclease-3
MDWPVVFRSHSDIEAQIVRGLLETHGIDSIPSTGPGPSVFPFNAEGLVEVRIAVPPDQAETAIRIIAEHREQVTGGVVVPLERAIADLEQRIGYRFRDLGLLEHALTHKSKAHEDATGGVVDNESLEFLGDAVLGFVVADLLYREFPHFQEGQKSKAKAALVSTAALAELAQRIGLGAYLLLCWPTAARPSSRRSISMAASTPPATSSSASCAMRSSTCARQISCATSSQHYRSVCRRMDGRFPSTR